MTENQLKEVMKFHLTNFNRGSTQITDETVHSDVLSSDDGFGSANSQRIYKSVIRWTLVTNGEEDRRWPNNWMDMTVAGLAPRLLAAG